MFMSPVLGFKGNVTLTYSVIKNILSKTNVLDSIFFIFTVDLNEIVK